MVSDDERSEARGLGWPAGQHSRPPGVPKPATVAAIAFAATGAWMTGRLPLRAAAGTTAVWSGSEHLSVNDAASSTPHLDALATRLSDALIVEAFGFEQFADIADERQRAIVCDQLLSTVDAVGTNLSEVHAHVATFVDLVGPNGRRMPDPDEPNEKAEMDRLDRELVGAFRAGGSVVDCLAGATIAVLRLPLSIQRADASAFGRLGPLAASAKGDAVPTWTRAVTAVDTARTNPAGWFEWMLEMRNAVVHRARQLRIWLPHAAQRRTGRQFFVRSDQPLARLLRYEPHLRRWPWLPDLAALSANTSAIDNWLAEPATQTLPGLLARVEALVEVVAEVLVDVWDQVASQRVHLPAPVAAWPPDHGSPPARVAIAEKFAGFDPDHAGLPLTAIVMNPREARRAEIAERLRRM